MLESAAYARIHRLLTQGFTEISWSRHRICFCLHLVLFRLWFRVGDNNGEVVFGKFSRMGNGEVSVTAHPASTPRPKSAEWWFEEEELERMCLRSGKVNDVF